MHCVFALTTCVPSFRVDSPYARLERLEREEWLAESEDKVTSPRTQRRRVLHRTLHRALMRQRDKGVICRWGCGQWMRAGPQEFLHQRELCPRRILQCVLKCPCRKTEEEWLAPYVPPEDVPDEASEDDALSRDDTDSEDDAADLEAFYGPVFGRELAQEGGGEDPTLDDGTAITAAGSIAATAVSAAAESHLSGSLAESSFAQYPELTVQRHHEEKECPRRLVGCPRRCGEWINFEDLKVHVDTLCVKRPFPPLVCRLGCGETFSGGVHRMLQCEEDRIEHETEMCINRTVRYG